MQIHYGNPMSTGVDIENKHQTFPWSPGSSYLTRLAPYSFIAAPSPQVDYILSHLPQPELV